jgi:SAM-dependent methyltransferase
MIDSAAQLILDLSLRVSISAVFMKPFVRFSPQLTTRTAQRYWDFDNLLQRAFWRLLDNVASTDEIMRLGETRWRQNLTPITAYKKKRLEQFATDRTASQQFEQTPFYLRPLLDRARPSDQFLYLGAGTGTECLQLALKGVRVIGIDYLVEPVAIGQRWAKRLGCPAFFVAMDGQQLGFSDHTFDVVFLEFYGSLPSLEKNIAFQAELARVLKPGGTAILNAARRGYASHWYLMGQYNDLDPALYHWLRPHTELDFFFTSKDASEERLLYGLYNRAYTIPDLLRDLTLTFKVESCAYSPDPRYITAVVHPKDGPAQERPIEHAARPPLALEYIEPAIEQGKKICGVLDTHANRVIEYVRSTGSTASLNQLQPDLVSFLALLDDFFSIFGDAAT